MILEIATLNVRPGQEAEFERVFSGAQKIIASAEGYLSHQLQRCLETPGQYVLLVNWRTLEDHEIGFRQSAAYAEWKMRLHHFYDPFPTVQHFVDVFR